MDKIKNKLLVILLLVTLLPVLLIGGYALFSSMRVLQKSSIAIHESRVALTAERIEKYFASVNSDLFYLRDSNSLHLYFGALKSKSSHSERLLLTNLRSSLRKFSEQKGIYQQVRFIDIKGMEVVRIDRNKGKSRNISDTVLQDKSSSEYFKQTINKENDALYISDIGLNRENGRIEQPIRPVIHFSTPVFNKDNTLQGILVLNIKLDEVFGFIEEQEKKGEELTFTSSEGYYYYHTNAEKRWGSATDLATKTDLYSEHPTLKDKVVFTKKLANLETEDGIGSYKSIILNDGKTHLGNLISIAPKAVVYELERDFLYVFLGIILLTLILSFSLALFLSYLVTQPLVQLTDSVDKLSKGDLETPIIITSDDEIGKLAHAVELLRKSMKILMKRAA